VPLNRGPFDGKTCEVPLLPTKIFVVRRTTSAEPEPGYLVHLALDHPGVQPPVAIGAAIIGVYRWRADSGAFEWTGTLEGE
jgi:hypothetical protein